eukprot:jgi/Ulvmu1/12147/UM085_0011.1
MTTSQGQCQQQLEAPAWKQRLYNLSMDHTYSVATLWIAVLLNIAVVTSSLTYVYSSLPIFRVMNARDSSAPIPFGVAVHDFVCALLFSAEAALRLFRAPSLWRLLTRTSFVLDLLALVPWYSQTLAGANLAVLSAARVLRIVRVLLMSRRIKTLLLLIGTTFRRAATMLLLLACLTTMMICMLGLLLWPAERGEWDAERRMFVRTSGWSCPVICERKAHFGVFAGCSQAGEEIWIRSRHKLGVEQHRCIAMQEESPFSSITACVWFETVTIATAGYGDIYPITDAGRTIAVFTMLLGVVAIALPVTVVGNTFNATYNEMFKAQDADDMTDDEANLYVASVAMNQIGSQALSGCSALTKPALLKHQIQIQQPLLLSHKHLNLPVSMPGPHASRIAESHSRPPPVEQTPPSRFSQTPSAIQGAVVDEDLFESNGYDSDDDEETASSISQTYWRQRGKFESWNRKSSVDEPGMP